METDAMDKSRIKEFFILLRHSPEYLYALVIVTFFSIGIIIGQYLKDGGYL
jgi:ABC-type phosphate/phosphonate transport system permease subunit